MRLAEFTLMLNEQREAYLVSTGYRRSETKGKLNDPETIGDFMCSAYNADRLPEEHVWLLCFDTKMHHIGTFEISKGTANSSLIDARTVYRNALMCNATNIILVHNHPSGDRMPSNADIAVTKQIIEAGKLLNVPLLDHVIIGKFGNYYSMQGELKC